MNLPQEKFEDNDASTALTRVIGVANEIILGKEGVIRLALTCLIARGHQIGRAHV